MLNLNMPLFTRAWMTEDYENLMRDKMQVLKKSTWKEKQLDRK